MGYAVSRAPNDDAVLAEHLIDLATLNRETTTHKLTVKAHSAVINRGLYVAVEVLDKVAGTANIEAVVINVERHGSQIAWQVTWEEKVPLEVECPAFILNLLTPTLKPGARHWRAACQNRATEAEKRRRIFPGILIETAKPISFNGGKTKCRVFRRLVQQNSYAGLDVAGNEVFTASIPLAAFGSDYKLYLTWRMYLQRKPDDGRPSVVEDTDDEYDDIVEMAPSITGSPMQISLF